jgi:hypothetical protein
LQYERLSEHWHPRYPCASLRSLCASITSSIKIDTVLAITLSFRCHHFELFSSDINPRLNHHRNSLSQPHFDNQPRPWSPVIPNIAPPPPRINCNTTRD